MISRNWWKVISRICDPERLAYGKATQKDKKLLRLENRTSKSLMVDSFKCKLYGSVLPPVNWRTYLEMVVFDDSIVSRKILFDFSVLENISHQ